MTTSRGMAEAAPITIDLPLRVARNVRAEVARNGNTQKEIADLLGIAQQAVSARMRGKTPVTLRELELLAQHWGMPVVDLILGRPSDGPDDNQRPRQGSNLRPSAYKVVRLAPQRQLVAA